MADEQETPTQLDPLATQAYAKDTQADSTVRSARSGAGRIIHFYVDNRQNVVDVFLKFYNLAYGDVTLGTTVPLATWRVDAKDEAEVLVPKGWACDTGISYACVTTGGHQGTTPPPSPVATKIRTIAT